MLVNEVMNLRVPKMKGISQLAEELLALQEGLCSKDCQSVSQLVRHGGTPLTRDLPIKRPLTAKDNTNTERKQTYVCAQAGIKTPIPEFDL
jgi:hypothetical protein